MNENFTVVLSWDVREDIVEAIKWDEKKRKGLGYEVDAEIDLRCKDVGKNPFHFQKIYGEARAAHLKRFPYSVLYWIDEPNRQVNIFGIHPQPDKPWKWKRRL